MNLARAFDIRDKDVVAFVGGGGKTTAMFRLAAELVAHGKRVLTTTTTRIFASQIQLAPAHFTLETEQVETSKLYAALERHPHVLLIGATNQEGKAFGVRPELVDALIALDRVDNVLVEADGSRMRPFKAPAEHEPVIPRSTTVLVPVVGIDVIGKTLTDAHVHRAELAARLADTPPGTRLNVQHVARVLSHARGGLKNKPPGARVVSLINKVETMEQLARAEQLAGLLLLNDAIDAVAIGSLHQPHDPISRLQSRVAAVVLAAGGSTRMQGDIKQLLPWGDTTFVGNAVRVAEHSHVSQIVVVTGNRAEQVQAQIAGTHVRVVNNPDWQSGRASSVAAGISAVDEKNAGAIFINADQPFLTSNVVNAILGAFYETGAPIVVPTYQGQKGSPVLFARELFAELQSLRGEQGGRDILRKYEGLVAQVEIEDTRAGIDLDTPEEYRNALQTQDATG